MFTLFNVSEGQVLAMQLFAKKHSTQNVFFRIIYQNYSRKSYTIESQKTELWAVGLDISEHSELSMHLTAYRLELSHRLLRAPTDVTMNKTDRIPAVEGLPF